METFAKGSEWRRWDLHLHTPETKKNDQYEGRTSEEKWNKFYEKISNYIGDGSDPTKNIAVIGVTDYLSIDNYKKVVADKRLPKSVQLILPNVEMRMTPISKKSPINIHCIFNPAFADKLESRFFAKLSFGFCGRKFSASREELIDLGRIENPSLNEKQALENGIDKFIINPDKLMLLLEEDKELRENTIIVLSNSLNDGASGLRTHGTQFNVYRTLLYRMTNLIFSSNKSDIDYFLGKGADSVKELADKIGILKPCIHGCDAHSLDKIFEPDFRRYCWIKADPTFNGLKQLIYEPEARVRIAETMPETKEDYQVIESVKIIDDNFQEKEIVFNDKLNCIIGGKSTGKSLLLENMAVAIDKHQADEKFDYHRNDKRELKNVTVTWADGSQSTRNDKVDVKDKHQIVYIPQTYINKLSDKQEDATVIDGMLKDILLQKQEFFELDQSIQKELKTQSQDLAKKVYDLLQKYNSVVEGEQKLKDIGSLDGINKEITKLEAEKKKLSAKASLEQEELAEYEDKLHKFNANTASLKQNATISRDVDLLTQLVEKAEIQYFSDDDISKRIVAAQEKAMQYADEIWRKEKATIKRTLDEAKAKLSAENKELEEYLQSMKAKIDSNKALSEITQKIQIQKAKEEDYSSKERKLKALKDSYDALKKDIVHDLLGYKSIHDRYASYYFEDDSLKFSIETVLQMDKFKDFLNNKLDRRQVSTFYKELDCHMDELKKEDFDEKLLDKIINLALSKSFFFRKTANSEAFLKELLQDWYISLYRINMDDDPLNEMSPGKKAIVLLKLLIKMANSTCPILIDQPEDDLDNRSIFNDLIPFIKNKKINRQIIVVTHNANIVLGGDAEEVIVANRDGAKTPNQQYKFEYLSGSIENNEAAEENSKYVLLQKSIQEHICEIMEGGHEAFSLRKHKYNM